MSWVDDFSQFQSTSQASIAGKTAPTKKSPTRKEQLEAELKLLEWHKLANEAAIKVNNMFQNYFSTIYLITISYRLL